MSSAKGKPKYGARGPRPHTWKTGLDPYKHSMYNPWLKARAQSNFRNEDWRLEFEDFYALWNGSWHLRGRKGHNLCMSRLDVEGPWIKGNIQLMTIKEHRARQGSLSVGITRNRKNPKPKYTPKTQYKKMVVTHG